MTISPLLRQAILDQLHAKETAPQTLAALAKKIDPTTIQTPALDLIDGELMRLLDEPGGRLIISMPPQQGKSVRTSQVFPVHALIQRPDTPVIVASYGEQLAERNGETIRNIISWNDLGIKVAAGSASKRRWRIEGKRGGVLSAGIGSGMTGWASGLTVIDDPIKDQQEADSEAYRDRVWNWWLTVAQTRLAPGAPVVVVLTRWHTDDLAGRLLAQVDGHRWRVLNIPAQCENEETDPLGRKLGEYMQSARYMDDKVTGRQRPMTKAENDEYWEKIKVGVGARTWAALYQGRPTAAEGGLIKRDWLARRYSYPLWEDRDGHNWLIGFDDVLISADLTFKGTKHSDYVAIGVWARRGADVYLLDQVRARLDFMSALRAFDQLVRLWPQAALKLVEDKANGPALMSMLGRRIPGIVPYEPRGSKQARANAWAPFAEAGNVWLPSLELAPWVDEYVEELAAFPNGAHDDQVDQTSMALDRLLVRPLADSTVYDEDDYDDYRIGY